LERIDAVAIERMGFEKVKVIHKKYSNISETVNVGGKTCKFRSQGEKRLAQYLELLKVGGYIKDWAFEQTMFKTSSGDNFWLVDFDVLNNDGTFEYYEFKGAVKQRDITKLQLLFESNPDTVVTFVFENRNSAAKFARRKVSNLCKGIFLQSTSGKGLTEFDGKSSRQLSRRKRKR
jgi:hypothetical protein